MDFETWIFKGNQRISRILPSEIDKDFLKILFETLEEINKQALRLELERVENLQKTAAKPMSEEDFKKLREQIEGNYKVHVEIASQRDFISSESPSVFDDKNFPNNIIAIKFDNSFFYKAMFNKEPLSKFVVELDFRKPPLVDFNSNPSLPTGNNSVIRIFGEDATWVEGAYSRINELLNAKKTKRTWFHRSNIYDLFLWLLIIPIAFWNLYKLEVRLHPLTNQVSGVFIVFFYIYLFLIILNISRFLFAYLRWLFPYIEFTKPPRTGYRLHRTVISLIAIGLATTLVYDIIKGIVTLIF